MMDIHYDYFIAYTGQDLQLAQTLKADINTIALKFLGLHTRNLYQYLNLK